MKIFHVGSLVVCSLLMFAGVSHAVIRADLESPTNLQTVSGIGFARGWTFIPGEEDNEPNVTLMVDGILRDDLGVSCCSARRDVELQFGDGTRLNSGFGIIVNYGELSPGPHTIGVHIIADGEDTIVINHSVIVVRPGDTSFVNNFNLSGATCTVAGDTVMITGAQVDGAATDVDLAYAPDLQAFAITNATGGLVPVNFVANLTSNQEVPRVDTDSEGQATVALNADNTLTYSITTTSLEDATAAHIHLGSANESGPILITLNGGPTTWSGTTDPLTTDQLDALYDARLYINVHTVENPNGEIRGQIVSAP
ncbi:MAG: CHRD domain-containing protein [Candidatus Binatia bacterium]